MKQEKYLIQLEKHTIVEGGISLAGWEVEVECNTFEIIIKSDFGGVRVWIGHKSDDLPFCLYIDDENKINIDLGQDNLSTKIALATVLIKELEKCDSSTYDLIAKFEVK